MKAYKSEKHKKSEKNDGHNSANDRTKGDKKNQPQYENFDRKPVE